MMQIGLKDMYSVAMINMHFWFKKNTEIRDGNLLKEILEYSIYLMII